MKEVDVGTVEGTGAAINIELGFTPRYFKCFNLDDVGGLAPTLEWFEGMPAASAIKTLKVVDNATTGNASSAKITSNGISEYAGSDASAAVGITIGADTDVNVSGETIHFIAFR